MLVWFRRPRSERTRLDRLAVSFCDSCAQVCDATCRATAHRAATEVAVLTGFRF